MGSSWRISKVSFGKQGKRLGIKVGQKIAAANGELLTRLNAVKLKGQLVDGHELRLCLAPEGHKLDYDHDKGPPVEIEILEPSGEEGYCKALIPKHTDECTPLTSDEKACIN